MSSVNWRKVIFDDIIRKVDSSVYRKIYYHFDEKQLKPFYYRVLKNVRLKVHHRNKDGAFTSAWNKWLDDNEGY